MTELAFTAADVNARSGDYETALRWLDVGRATGPHPPARVRAAPRPVAARTAADRQGLTTRGLRAGYTGSGVVIALQSSP